VAPDSNAELDAVVTKALAKDPAERYAAAGEFARDARRAVGVSSREPGAVGARPRRGLGWIAAIAAAAVIAVVVIAVLTSGGEEAPPAAAAIPHVKPAAIRLDPETGSAEQAIGGFTYRQAPTYIGDLGVGEGGVWVGAPPLIYHLDPVTSTIRDSIPNPLPGGSLAVGFRTIWVATANEVQRINPATDEPLGPVHLEDPQGIKTTSKIAVGEHAVWATTQAALYRIDPITARVIGKTEITGSTGLAVGDGTVWVVDDLTGTLTAFEGSDGNVRDSVALPGSLDGVVAGGGSVWVLDREAGVVSVVDPHTLRVLDTVRVGGDERDMVFGADAVWLADGADRTVTHMDPVDRRTTTFDVPGEAASVSVDQDGEVWVLSVPAA
jgi:YVTN family beta-propeller protein